MPEFSLSHAAISILPAAMISSAVGLALLGLPVALAMGSIALIVIFLLYNSGMAATLSLPLTSEWSLIADSYTQTILSMLLFIAASDILQKAGYGKGFSRTMRAVIERQPGGAGITLLLCLSAVLGAVPLAGALLPLIALQIQMMLQIRQGADHLYHQWPCNRVKIHQKLQAGLRDAALVQLIPPSALILLLAAYLDIPAKTAIVATFVPAIVLSSIAIIYLTWDAIWKPWYANFVYLKQHELPVRTLFEQTYLAKLQREKAHRDERLRTTLATQMDTKEKRVSTLPWASVQNESHFSPELDHDEERRAEHHSTAQSIETAQIWVEILKYILAPAILAAAFGSALILTDITPLQVAALAYLCSVIMSFSYPKSPLGLFIKSCQSTALTAANLVVTFAALYAFTHIFIQLGGMQQILNLFAGTFDLVWPALIPAVSVIMLSVILAMGRGIEVPLFLLFLGSSLITPELQQMALGYVAQIQAGTEFVAPEQAVQLWALVGLLLLLRLAYLLPPTGVAIFYLKKIFEKQGSTPLSRPLLRPNDTKHIYKSLRPYILLQISGLILIVFYPDIIIWLPSLMAG